MSQNSYVLGDGQRLLLRATPKDRLGREADVERPTWALEDLGGNPERPCALLEVSPHDPTVCAVTALKQGAAVVKFTCDADLGEGVAVVSRSIHLQVVAFAAVAVEIDGQLVDEEELEPVAVPPVPPEGAIADTPPDDAPPTPPEA